MMDQLKNNNAKSRDWLGYIGIVRFREGALTANEISQLFSRERIKYGV